MIALTRLFFTLSVFALLAMTPDAAQAGRHCGADGCGGGGGGGGGKPDGGNDGGGDTGGLSSYPWMHPDVGTAFDNSLDGTGSHIIVLDNYGGTRLQGNFDGKDRRRTHGQWTSIQSGLVAPGATLTEQSNAKSTGSIADIYAGTGLQVVNLSFGLVDPPDLDLAGYTLGNEFWDSLVTEAQNGTAVFVKAAGNLNGEAPDATFNQLFIGDVQDYLNLTLKNASGAIFVGALDKNGTTLDQASMAGYSAIAGSFSDQFVVVGVEDGITNLQGTSFAAPIVTGYAAIIGQKFTDPVSGIAPAAELVVDKLLDTARKDTIQDYEVSVHGQGEASLINALAPIDIPG